MDVVVATSLDAHEHAVWRRALEAAAPEFRWLDANGGEDAASAEAAVVANPYPGALAGLPKLRLIQSLWAGVDRLLADPNLPRDVPIAP